jgi:hypothetical protein
LFARTNPRAAPWRSCHHAHHPGGNAAAEPDRASVAAAALAYRHVQTISITFADFNSDATTVHGEVSGANDQSNRQRNGRASDTTRGV